MTIHLICHSFLSRLGTFAKKEHGDFILYIERYLKGTADLDIVLNQKQDQGFRVYADADEDFSDNWLKEYAKFDPTNTK